ncbi:hypothetical protein AO735_03545 [Pseudomonas sp. TTU2014-096BSC]|nr:hypothetical protein AO735_03545 [Pseudomonas sp. TTU2014-096BSC]
MPMPPRPHSRPHPRTFICPACNWKHTVIPLSDCLMEGRDWFSDCPKCRHDELETRLATQAEIMKERLANFLNPLHH